MAKKIVGVFNSEQEATRAIEDLKEQGYRAEDISVVAKNRDDLNSISDETGTKAPEGLATGATTGGILGGVTGLLAGIGLLAIPGVGPILAAGPIAATLTGAAVGAGAGGLVGGLIGMGIPEEEAHQYDNYVNEGKILVMVDSDSALGERAYSILGAHRDSSSTFGDRDYSTTDTVTPGMADRSGAVSRFVEDRDNRETRSVNSNLNTSDEDRTLELKEEQLDVNKNRVQTGEVQVRKEVVEDQKTINVPVSREEVVVERHAVHNESTDEPIGQDETIRIPVSEERVEVNKRPVVTGEVNIRKQEHQETQHVQDTVKREEARVERSGDPNVRGDETFARDTDTFDRDNETFAREDDTSSSHDNPYLRAKEAFKRDNDNL